MIRIIILLVDGCELRVLDVFELSDNDDVILKSGVDASSADVSLSSIIDHAVYRIPCITVRSCRGRHRLRRFSSDCVYIRAFTRATHSIALCLNG